MAKAKYTHQTDKAGDIDLLIIEDLNTGAMSVTNDIENVVDEIAISDGLNVKNHLIVYKDTDGIWDGWDHVTQSFVPLQTRNLSDAITKFVQRHSIAA